MIRRSVSPTTRRISKRNAGTAEASEPSRAGAELLQDGWERFWFTPQRNDSLRLVRLGLGLAAAVYFLSHWSDIGHWFGGGGMLSTERLGQLVQSTGAGRWNLTPLYWIESTPGLRGALGLGAAASLVMAAGIGGRWIVALVWLALISVVARCWVISGIVETPLVIGIGALLVAGGSRWGSGESVRRWTTGLARRLLQVHAAALVAIGALSQLAAEVWWDGTAVVHLVLRQDGPAWDFASVIGGPIAAAFLTHALLWIPILTVPLLWVRRTRRGAAIALILHALASGLLSGQMLYGAVVAVFIGAFLTGEEER